MGHKGFNNMAQKTGSIQLTGELLRGTLRFLVSQLSSNDRFGLVVWDDDVRIQFPVTPMNSKGKEAAVSAIKDVNTRGCTNLSGGLFKAIDEVLEDKHVDEPGRSSAVLLFTDGHANRWITDNAQLNDCVRGGLAKHNSVAAPAVFTFGFGSDHDAEMLRGIADEGNGLYYYIENKEAIPGTFADCLS